MVCGYVTVERYGNIEEGEREGKLEGRSQVCSFVLAVSQDMRNRAPAVVCNEFQSGPKENVPLLPLWNCWYTSNCTGIDRVEFYPRIVLNCRLILEPNARLSSVVQ